MLSQIWVFSINEAFTIGTLAPTTLWFQYVGGNLILETRIIGPFPTQY